MILECIYEIIEGLSKSSNYHFYTPKNSDIDVIYTYSLLKTNNSYVALLVEIDEPYGDNYQEIHFTTKEFDKHNDFVNFINNYNPKDMTSNEHDEIKNYNDITLTSEILNILFSIIKQVGYKIEISSDKNIKSRLKLYDRLVKLSTKHGFKITYSDIDDFDPDFYTWKIERIQ